MHNLKGFLRKSSRRGVLTMDVKDLLKMLASIARDRGHDDLAKYVELYEPTPVYKITVMPEATCEGCQ